MRRILLIDDEPKIRKLIGGMLEESGYSVDGCERCAEARSLLDGHIYDLMISDVRLPDGSGVELLENARAALTAMPVILITAYGTIDQAVEAMRLGALDYLQKPFEMEALRRLVERAFESAVLREELEVLRTEKRRGRPERRLVARSAPMREVAELVERVAPTPSTVLLQGESGAGKEIVAETIHRLGPSASRTMVRVNCLAIPAELMESELFGHVRGAFTGAHASRRGWFELANGSTLFLDEISDLPLPLQGKLLRALEDRRITRLGSSEEIPVEARLVASTKVDLRDHVKAGLFRDDLFFRLNVFPIVVPPLRERREDLPELVEALLGEIGARMGQRAVAIDPAAAELLSGYSWPGNVRELRNVLERALVLAFGEPIGVPHLPSEVIEAEPATSCGEQGSFAEQVEAFQGDLLVRALSEAGWVKKDAAERLGLSPRAFSYYVGKLGADRFRPPR